MVEIQSWGARVSVRVVLTLATLVVMVPLSHAFLPWPHWAAAAGLGALSITEYLFTYLETPTRTS